MFPKGQTMSDADQLSLQASVFYERGNLLEAVGEINNKNGCEQQTFLYEL